MTNTENIQLESNANNAKNKKDGMPRKTAINLGILSAGFIGFLLPWVTVKFMGFVILSLSGFSMPGLSDSINGNKLSSYSSGFDPIYLLYFIPICYIILGVMEYLRKSKGSFIFNIIIILCVLLFFVVFFMETGKEGLEYLGIGPWITIIAAIVHLFTRKKHQQL